MVDVGVIIVSYNVADLLRKCLRSVLASQGVRLTVCVVDNCSTDGSAEMVAAEFPEAHLIVSPENRGYSAANNLGIRYFRALSSPPRYILLLNPDTEVPPDGIARMVAYLDSHPEAGVAGPKLVRPDGSLDLACRRSFPTPEVSFYRMVGLSRLFPKSRRFGRYNLTYLDPDVETEVDSVVGAFMLIRRQALDEVGLMDEDFFLYGEDLDLAFRIKARGWKVLYYPKVVVLHHKGESTRRSRLRSIREFYRAMLIFYRKHYAPTSPRLLRWLVTAGIYLRWGVALAVTRLEGLFPARPRPPA
jgi:N-acetylglucosaminyl-diphospho-decaprenol L-rhamnosyltransferase